MIKGCSCTKEGQNIYRSDLCLCCEKGNCKNLQKKAWDDGIEFRNQNLDEFDGEVLTKFTSIFFLQKF